MDQFVFLMLVSGVFVLSQEERVLVCYLLRHHDDNHSCLSDDMELVFSINKHLPNNPSSAQLLSVGFAPCNSPSDRGWTEVDTQKNITVPKLLPWD